MDLSGISLSDADGQVFLAVAVVAQRAPVDSATLMAWLAEKGYGDCLIHTEAIEQAAIGCNNQHKPFMLLVAQRRDAAIHVQVTPDDMTATLSIAPPRGGKAATPEAVMQALAAAGVVKGVDQAAVAWACQQDACSDIAVASGQPPKDGHDAVFEELIPAMGDRAPQVDENGLIDYREHGSIAIVRSGEPLMRRQPATPGVDGHTVRGKVLSARPGTDQPFAAALAGAEVAQGDANLLQASLTGQPVRVQHGVMVEPILRIPEVNMSTGNIHYDGVVHVDGEVGHGMKVQASGDIVVGGMVDGGVLEAGGNITVAGGVVGRATLRAGGSVTARFAEAVQIHAGTLIVIHDMALECELQSLNQIIVGDGSPQRGRLIGGVTTAMMQITTPQLGSPTSGVTRVVLGCNPELDARRHALQERIEKEDAAHSSLHKLVTHLTTFGDPKGLLERAKMSRQHAATVYAQSLVERDELDRQIALGRTATLQVGVGVAGAVDLCFGRLAAPLRRDYRGGVFRVDSEGQIVFIDSSGYAVPVP
ncbi:DUF342 domain-containing protein [Rhodoferax sp.]|uniref:DUF342 domain-containing protein n=1 Tax=Rhodoferax sp. TaxID=50421 RepID=UPI002760D2FB|nr:FapA family protein [Rhodoferax sp.]